MLTGNLVLVRTAKSRVIPRFLKRDDPYWLEIAESLLMIFREATGMTRGEIESEVHELVGEGIATLTHRGLAKVLEDRAEFEVVADMPPEVLREKVFLTAAEQRRSLRGPGPRRPFRRDEVLRNVSRELKLDLEKVILGLFADLKDENRLLRFDDLSAQRLIDRYNVALAQAVLLRSVRIEVLVRRQKPARYRQLFRLLKFHRLLYRVEGSMDSGYLFKIDGPLSLFIATNRYGLQIALFLPALLLCDDFRLDAELRWGPKREPRTFHLESSDELVSHYVDSGTYTPAEIQAFVERFRQVVPSWQITNATEIVNLGREGVWVPDFKFIHSATGIEVLCEIVGFWKKSSLERLLHLLPKYGLKRYVLAISDRLKVDEEALAGLTGPVLRFKEIPNATELGNLLAGFLDGAR
jgi:predicted nuclease of restriction endonuclease-like RecB superfamily